MNGGKEGRAASHLRNEEAVTVLHFCFAAFTPDSEQMKLVTQKRQKKFP